MLDRPTRLALAAGACAILVLAGCGSSSDGDDTKHSGAVRIVNDSLTTIKYAYLSPTTQQSWGSDQLGSEVIAPGDSFLIYSVPPDTYDLRIEFSDGGIYYELDFSVSSGRTTEIIVEGHGDLRLINNTGVTVQQAFLRPIYGTWGSDQLGSDVIYDDESFLISDIPAGTYDLNVVLDNGTEMYEYDVLIRADSIRTITLVGTGALQLVNATTVTIVTAELSPSSSDTWGSDQLGDEVILSGESFTIEDVPADRYDLRLTFSDDDVVTEYGFDIDAGDTHTITIYQTATAKTAVIEEEAVPVGNG